MDFEDEWVTRAWRHEAGNFAQTVYAAEEYLEGDYETALPELGGYEDISPEDLRQLSTSLGERIPHYSTEDLKGLNAEAKARQLKDVTEAVLALETGGESIRAGEVTKVLEHFGLDHRDSNQELKGNGAWRLPLHTIAKNSEDHGGSELYSEEYLSEDAYGVELFDNGDGLEPGMGLDEIWENGESTDYGNSGFGLNMAYRIAEQLGGEVASYTFEDGDATVYSPTGDFSPEPGQLKGLESDTGVGFVVEMPLSGDQNQI